MNAMLEMEEAEKDTNVGGVMMTGQCKHSTF